MNTYCIRRHIIVFFLSFSSLGVMAQESSTFSVMTLNVDGLPAKFFSFDINQDGPLSEGSERISIYLAEKDCDILSLQECFNYRWEIWSRLFGAYDHDEWTGGIGTEYKELDLLHLQNERFPCDGLNCIWKKDILSTAYEREPHNRSFGKFSHEFDEFITKGFRRHEFTLNDGTQIIVYNTHFDASSERDEKAGNDVHDREARLSQWKQLRNHLLSHLDSRPVIITGDFNSHYYRDSVKTAFINSIEDTGRATVCDAWIQTCNQGIFPEIGDPATSEPYDKILYVNPVGGTTVELLSLTVDSVGYRYDGKPLGDHYPVIATFKVNDGNTGIKPLTGDSQNRHQIYDLKGIKNTPSRKNIPKGVYIIDGRKQTR